MTIEAEAPQITDPPTESPAEPLPPENFAGEPVTGTALAAVQTRLAETELLLARAREALDATERKRQIERELARQGTTDHAAALILTEAAVAAMPEPDIAAAVADLKRRAPALFTRPAPRPSASMGARDGEPSDAHHTAAAARATGDRGLLLKYLRLRRSP